MFRLAGAARPAPGVMALYCTAAAPYRYLMAEHAIDYIEAIAAEFPDRQALTFRGSDGFSLRLSYGQLDQRLNRAANVLASLGVAPGDHVGCHLYDTPVHVDVMLGAWKMGAVPININFRYLDEELRYLFEDADLKLVVSEPALADRAQRVAQGCQTIQQVVVADGSWDQRLSAASPERPPIERTGDEHYILYTGGTTGMPKGVVWRHTDILHAAFSTRGFARMKIPAVPNPQAAVDALRNGPPRYSARPCTCPLFPLMHGGGQWAMMVGLVRGMRRVLITDVHFDPEFFLQVLAEERVNGVSAAGDAHARPVVDAVNASHGGVLDLPELRSWNSSAVMMSPAVKEDLAKALPDTRIVDGLGASESGGQGAFVGYGEEGSPRFRLNEGHVILDDEMQPIDPSERRIGRLAKTGRIPIGYYKDPEKTAETFPVIDGVRYTMPGDLARWEEDGTVTLFGRGSLSINTGGEKVFPEEVEKALKSHEAVLDAVVVGTPDDRFGQRVTAVVQLRSGYDDPGLEALTAHSKRLLSGYKAPRALVLVDEIVRSPSGKPDYRWAKATALERM